MKSRRQSIPSTVLERARVAVETSVKPAARKPAEPKTAPARATRGDSKRTKAKVIAALKKLHPMD